MSDTTGTDTSETPAIAATAPPSAEVVDQHGVRITTLESKLSTVEQDARQVFDTLEQRLEQIAKPVFEALLSTFLAGLENRVMALEAKAAEMPAAAGATVAGTATATQTSRLDRLEMALRNKLGNFL